MSQVFDLLEQFAEQKYFKQAAVARKLYSAELLTYEQYYQTKKDQLFDLASLTKVLVTTFTYMHYWQHHLNSKQETFSRPLCEWTPFFQSPDKKDITLEHLFRHTSGLAQWYPLYLECYQCTHAELYKFLDSMALDYATGAERKYSDLGFLWLEAIFPYLAGGKELYQYWHESFVKQLSLSYLLYLPLKHFQLSDIVPSSQGNEFEKKMVEEDDFGFQLSLPHKHFSHWRTSMIQGEMNDGNGHYAKRGVSSHCGLFGSLGDTLKLAEQLWNQDIFSEKTRDFFLSVDQFGGGLGFARADRILQLGVDANSWAGHHGFTGCTVAWRLGGPEKRETFVFLSNRLIFGLDQDNKYPDWKKIGKSILSF